MVTKLDLSGVVQRHWCNLRQLDLIIPGSPNTKTRFSNKARCSPQNNVSKRNSRNKKRLGTSAVLWNISSAAFGPSSASSDHHLRCYISTSLSVPWSASSEHHQHLSITPTFTRIPITSRFRHLSFIVLSSSSPSPPWSAVQSVPSPFQSVHLATRLATSTILTVNPLEHTYQRSR